uniref:Uncharacterized protein n=1 Tax=Arundo donax TaxID=35708 RepID=A0A0A9C7G2_ARUDO
MCLFIILSYYIALFFFFALRFWLFAFTGGIRHNFLLLFPVNTALSYKLLSAPS